MTRIQLSHLGFVLLTACGELSRTPGVADAGSDGGGVSSRLPCDVCPTDVTQCLTGECAWKCGPIPAAACKADFRCWDGLCVPEILPSCDDSPCNRDQACLSTYCVGSSLRSCTPGGTECGVEEACLGDPPTCASLPPCDADGTCRPGTLGAVCNRNRLGQPDTDPRREEDLCLLGRCTSNDHCPSPLTCQDVGAEVVGLGVCR